MGELARAVFGSGKLVSPGPVDCAAADTAELLDDPHCGYLYEAAFAHEDVAIRADIISKYAGGLELIEVKSSTRVKDEHLLDCAIQAWVIGQARGGAWGASRWHTSIRIIYTIKREIIPD